MDEKKYISLVEEGAVIRRDLNDNLHPRYGKIRRAFKELFPQFESRDRLLKRAVDLVHYQGGYPRPTSPAKIDDLVDEIEVVTKLFEAAQIDDLKNKLANRGISLKVVSGGIAADSPLSEDNWAKAKKAWNRGMGSHVERPRTQGECIRLMITHANDLQTTICQESDEIKVGMADTAETEHGIRKPNFLEAVSLKAVEIKKGAQKMLERKHKVDETRIDNLSAAIDPLETKVTEPA